MQKKELLGLVSDYFAEARERRRDLEKRPDYVMDVLREGAKKGRAKAEILMEKVRDAVGLVRALS